MPLMGDRWVQRESKIAQFRLNILGILGVASTVKPLSATGITKLDLWVMVGFSIALLPLLYTDLKLQRWEGGILLFGYGAYLWFLWP